MRKREFIAGGLAAFATGDWAGADHAPGGLEPAPEWLTPAGGPLTDHAAAARRDGKRLALLWERRGCGYCRRLKKEVLEDEAAAAWIDSRFRVVRMNVKGEHMVADFDGFQATEKDLARRWGVVMTPTILFPPPQPPAAPGIETTVAIMPGLLKKDAILAMFRYVDEEAYTDGVAFGDYQG